MNFISFEGIEGCGKSTQAKKLYDFFIAKKIDSILTREPGGCFNSEKIRELLLAKNIESLNSKSEVLLNFAARIEHIEKTIIPAIKQNKIVISDRFFDSTFAYQGNAMGIDYNQIEIIKNFSIGNFKPDITFLIDIPVELAFERIKQRSENNRYDELGIEFHQKVREGFLKLSANQDRIVVIDGSANQEEVFQQILQYTHNLTNR